MFASSVLTPPAACYRLVSSSCARHVEQQQSAQSGAAAAHQQQKPFIPAAMEMKGGGWQNAVIGPVLQCMEAATLGMPLEVWKTYMGRNRDATTLGAIKSIYQQGGGGFPGVAAFWAGTGPKVRSFAVDPCSLQAYDIRLFVSFPLNLSAWVAPSVTVSLHTRSLPLLATAWTQMQSPHTESCT